MTKCADGVLLRLQCHGRRNLKRRLRGERADGGDGKRETAGEQVNCVCGCIRPFWQRGSACFIPKVLAAYTAFLWNNTYNPSLRRYATAGCPNTLEVEHSAAQSGHTPDHLGHLIGRGRGGGHCSWSEQW